MPRSHRALVDEWDAAVASYTALIELHLAPNDNPATDYRFDLRVVLGNEPLDGAERRLEVRCSGVEALRVDNASVGSPIRPLQLEDLRARGWSHVAYRVSHGEQEGVLSFNCATLDWREIEPAGA